MTDAGSCHVTAKMVFSRTSNGVWEIDPLRTQLSLDDTPVSELRNGDTDETTSSSSAAANLQADS